MSLYFGNCKSRDTSYAMTAINDWRDYEEDEEKDDDKEEDEDEEEEEELSNKLITTMSGLVLFLIQVGKGKAEGKLGIMRCLTNVIQKMMRYVNSFKARLSSLFFLLHGLFFFFISKFLTHLAALCFIQQPPLGV